MSEDQYQWSPGLLGLLIDAIPLICKGKEDVFLFFEGCRVPPSDLAPWRDRFARDKASVKKHPMTRSVLQHLNDRGDSGLAARRAVLQRVVEFDQFTDLCWPDDRDKARARVAEIQKLVSHEDAVTRLSQAQRAEVEARRAERLARQQDEAKRRDERRALRRQIAMLRDEESPQRRGRLLEGLLNAVFALDGMLIRESFTRRDEQGVPQEQIDGVIGMDGNTWLVEMKWWHEPLDVVPVGSHLVRLFYRADCHGLIISASRYTEPAVEQIRKILSQKLVVLADLQEIDLVLERDGNLADWLRSKAQSARLDLNPYVPPRV
jgi:restriction system protein